MATEPVTIDNQLYNNLKQTTDDLAGIFDKFESSDKGELSLTNDEKNRLENAYKLWRDTLDTNLVSSDSESASE